ncbi:MAG: PCRF domain-containing protein, partial [Gammaproteobacteria bacterium]|nr:PCRF domain-containing protein [Gammaproteobacteria bacterium]
MKESIRERLQQISERHEEIAALLGDAEVIGDQNRFRDLSREYSAIDPVVQTFERYKETLGDLESANEMAKDTDQQMREMAQEEIESAQNTLADLETDLNTLLLPKDPRDESNVFLEIRAGTGGDEAAIFAGDLFRMYSRYAESKGWQ